MPLPQPLAAPAHRPHVVQLRALVGCLRDTFLVVAISRSAAGMPLGSLAASAALAAGLALHGLRKRSLSRSGDLT